MVVRHISDLEATFLEEVAFACCSMPLSIRSFAALSASGELSYFMISLAIAKF